MSGVGDPGFDDEPLGLFGKACDLAGREMQPQLAPPPENVVGCTCPFVPNHPADFGDAQPMRNLAAEIVPARRPRQPFARIGTIGLDDAVDRRGGKKWVSEFIFGLQQGGAIGGEIAAGQRGFRRPALSRKRGNMAGQPVDRLFGDMAIAGDLAAIDGEQRRAFRRLRELRDGCERSGHRLPELSMGMSGDYPVAVEEGATIVRLGTVLFGERA